MPDRLPLILAASLCLAITSACRLSTDLLPRTHTTSTSPDGRYRAFVRQDFNIDPPDDHLYLAAAGGTPRLLMDLAPDADWCRSIVWTNDSGRVGFLITDQQLAVFDSATAEHLAMLPLIKPDGYPGSQAARDVRFSDDGRVVSFERFERASHRSLGQEAITIPEERLSLRMTWDGKGARPKKAWVRVRLADAWVVDISVDPGADGAVELPAIGPGPFPFVELGTYGSSRTTILRDVRVTPDPVAVRILRDQ